MNKKTLLILITILFIIFISKANAESCSNAEKTKLKKEASNVKLVYEEDEEIVKITEQMRADGAENDLYNPFFNMKLTNVTSDFIVEISNDFYEGNVSTVRYSDTTNGVYEFRWDDVYKIVKFTYKVTGSSGSACPNDTLYIGYLVTPKYNYFSDYGICDGISDYKYCTKFVTFDMGYTEQYNKIKSYVAEKKEKENKKKTTILGKVSEFVNEHKILTIGGAMIMTAIGVTFVIMSKRRKRVK